MNHDNIQGIKQLRIVFNKIFRHVIKREDTKEGVIEWTSMSFSIRSISLSFRVCGRICMEDFISVISMRKIKEGICSKESVLFYHTQIMKNYQCKIYDSF
jgi:Zn-dependent M16 (insulinase) family peptidase